MSPITQTTKYLLIGAGSLIGISTLVWIGTQQSHSISDQASVGHTAEVQASEQVSKHQVPEKTQAHSAIRNEHMVAARSGAGSFSKNSNVHSIASSSVDTAPITESRGSGRSDGKVGHASSSARRSSRTPNRQSFNSNEHSALTHPKVQVLSRHIARQSFDDSDSNQNAIQDRGKSSSHTGQKIENFPNDSRRNITDPVKELITNDLIAVPLLSKLSNEKGQDYHENELMVMEPDKTFMNVQPPIPEESEIAQHPSSLESHQKMAQANTRSSVYPLEVVGIQGGFNAEYVAIPPTEKEDFEHVALFGAISFPKRYNYDSGWEIRFRMNGSMGVLIGGGDLGFIATIVPGIVFWYPEWNISINGGPGVAYVSREKYGRQDLGGPIQIVGQGGLTYYITDHIGVGWRFHHISDAGIWGSDNRGVDVNLFELTYKF